MWVIEGFAGRVRPSCWSQRRKALIAREYVLMLMGLTPRVRISSMRLRKVPLVRSAGLRSWRTGA